MADYGKLTRQMVETFVDLEDDEFSLERLRTKHNIDPSSSTFKMAISNMKEKRLIKWLGRGVYRKVKPVKPVVWWNGDTEEPLDFRFPKSYEDESSFGIEDMVEIFVGDMVLISGRSNYGKTAIALSILGENLSLMNGILMGSEYTATNGKASPKFKRRMKRMSWVSWMDGDGKPRFDLLPVGADYEDYVEPDKLNVIDWISLPGEYYLIDRVMKAIKDRVGNGVAVPVIQKNKDAEFGEGGERSERYADVVLKIDSFGKDESLLTVGRVKAPYHPQISQPYPQCQ
ncbi:hypothetical protein ES708_29854 [subsurface metagenome]